MASKRLTKQLHADAKKRRSFLTMLLPPVNCSVMWRVNAKWFHPWSLGHAVMVVLAAVLLLAALAAVVGFALGSPIGVSSWRFGHLSGMTALGFEIGLALLSLLIGAYSVRALILWKGKHT